MPKVAGILSRKKVRKWAGDAEDHPDHLEALAREALLSVEERGGGVKAARRLVAVAALLLEREEEFEFRYRRWLASRPDARTTATEIAASLVGAINAEGISAHVDDTVLTISETP